MSYHPYPSCSIRPGRLLKLIANRPGCQEWAVAVAGEKNEMEEKAIAYPALLGDMQAGDRVLLNTTAVELSLGSGGAHFVVANLSCSQRKMSGPGHIMKLRYTPLQLKVQAVEEESSPYHQRLKEFTSLDGLPVMAGELHSMVAPAAVGFKMAAGKHVKLAYIMTDGAALPLTLSRLVADLKEQGLIDLTITCGQAFGGDLEAINVYSALAAAKIAGAAGVIVAMGPGIVGTGTSLGFSGAEQAYILDAVDALGGTPIAIPRISFGDPRARHRGISHHTLTVLGKLTHCRAWVPIPVLPDEEYQKVKQDLSSHRITEKHAVRTLEAAAVVKEMEKYLIVTTMGRTPAEDPAFFLAAAAAGILAGGI